MQTYRFQLEKIHYLKQFTGMQGFFTRIIKVIDTLPLNKVAEQTCHRAKVC